MVEFLRLKAIIADDLSGTLWTWQANMEATTDKFLRDLDTATQTSTALPSKNAAVGVALRQFRAAAQLRVALPLTQLDEAREEMEKFIQSRLKELQSQQETKILIGELSSRITDHRGRVCQLLHSEPRRHPEVVPLIMVGLIPPIFSDLLFIPKMAKAVFEVVKPPVVLKALPPASSHKVPSTPHQPEDGGLELEVSKPGESAPSTSQTPQQVQEQTSRASDTDSGKADGPFPEEEQSRRSLKVKLPFGLLKHSHKATTSGSKDGATPSKVQKESEAKEAKASTLTRPPEAALQKAQFKLYKKDLPEVQEVGARILGLDKGEEVTQKALDSSSTFHLRWAVDETHPPTVIGMHWIDHLDSDGRIAKCKPHDFKFEDEWLPLYTRAGATRHVSCLSSLLKTQGDSPLIAVIPPDMLFQSEREYVIHQLHEADYLSRVTVYYGENQ